MSLARLRAEITMSKGSREIRKPKSVKIKAPTEVLAAASSGKGSMKPLEPTKKIKR